MSSSNQHTVTVKTYKKIMEGIMERASYLPVSRFASGK